MSFVLKLMIGGWATTLAMIGVCALNESGKLFNLRKRIASWIQPAEEISARQQRPYRYPLEVD
jgi:hypothetical protein